MARLRFQCRDCAKKGKGGFFTVKDKNVNTENVKCPYCGSSNVRLLG